MLEPITESEVRPRHLSLGCKAIVMLMVVVTVGIGVAAVFAIRARRIDDAAQVTRLVRQTKRIAVSSRDLRWRVVDISEPHDVNEIVRALTCDLEKAPREAPCQFDFHARFFLGNGEQVAVLLRPDRTRQFHDSRREIVAVKLPGRQLEEYFVSRGALISILMLCGRALKPLASIDVGSLRVGNSEARVELLEQVGGRLQVCVGCGHDKGKIHARDEGSLKVRIFGDGDRLLEETGGWTRDGATVFGCGRYLLEQHLTRLEISVDETTQTLGIPEIRFDDPPVPPCPRCGSSEHVLPCVYGELKGLEQAVFHSRCMFGGSATEDSPSFHCESCRESF